MIKFEHRKEKLLPRKHFLLRLARHALISVSFLVVSLWIGILGYHHYENMSWIDAFVNACMILGGMGPMGELNYEGGKIFAGIYALYSGLVVIIATGILAAPILHRFLHHFHMESE